MKTEVPDGLKVSLRQDRPIPLNCRIHCRAGELLALVGPSGGGKTTVLRCIAGLSSATSGSVFFNHIPWWDTGRGVSLPPQKRAAGMVFQDYALFPHLTALQNVEAGMATVASRQARKRRARELLELVNLGGLESRRPDALSGGQRQRVAIARALARDPDVLLLDEPFAAVDQITRIKLYRELTLLRQRINLPIVMVTHDIEEASMLADTMVLLHHGVTLQHGAPVVMMEQPDNAVVARLLGLTNIFTGTVTCHQDDPPITRVSWNGIDLECRMNQSFQPGDHVDLVVPNQHIILHQRVRPSRGERENPVTVEVTRLLRLGDRVRVETTLPNSTREKVVFSVPDHVARRNTLAAGEEVGISFVSRGIHLMPCQ